MEPTKQKKDPILWVCKCGWIGKVKEKMEDFCCPKCKEFNNIETIIQFKNPRSF